VQTTLLGLSIAFIIALIAALIGPYFIDWNQFRPQFETEATRVVGAPVRVGGELDARLLPTPSLRLRSVVVGGANDLGKVRADKLDVEFSLGSLMRGEWRATELTINGMALDLGLDSQGRIDWPASSGKFNLGSLAIDRLNLTGRIALHDAASRSTLELNDIAFSGDVRSLAGSVRGDGNFMLAGLRYPFRVSSGQSADGNATRVHLNIDPGARALSADLDGTLAFEARAPRFEGAMVLAVPPGLKASGDVPITPWRIAARVKADPAAARLEQVEASYGAEDSALKFAGTGEIRFGLSPLLRAALSARQLDADRFVAKDSNAAERLTIIHAPGRPNEYLYSSGTNTSDRPILLADDLAARPFAGSDFWLMDLGLEFFHWPEQRLLKPEMRHNRSCRVLESINPASDPAGYARVVSWIDLETDGLVCAEAYDRGNRLVKEFSVGSFRKVEGRYQLQDMKIRNAKTGRRTELEFDLKK